MEGFGGGGGKGCDGGMVVMVVAVVAVMFCPVASMLRGSTPSFTTSFYHCFCLPDGYLQDCSLTRTRRQPNFVGPHGFNPDSGRYSNNDI